MSKDIYAPAIPCPAFLYASTVVVIVAVGVVFGFVCMFVFGVVLVFGIIVVVVIG